MNMMNDSISRRATLDALCNNCDNPQAACAHYPCKQYIAVEKLPSAQPEPCDLCSNLEKGDTLYQWSDWDGGIGFDYIRDIQFCPKCGRRLK